MISGVLGYVLAVQNQSKLKTQVDDNIDLSSVSYGSLEDFKAAINSLRTLFPDEDSVTTDPDDLHDHGFSLNDYHPGLLFFF